MASSYRIELERFLEETKRSDLVEDVFGRVEDADVARLVDQADIVVDVEVAAVGSDVRDDVTL